MLAYIIRRLILAVFVLFLTTIIVFFAMRLLPSDPILMLVSADQAQEYNEEQIDQLKHEFGLDK
ncbi:MAG: ABC transporter permease, partial [Deltaproteobacteria bacterium]|nr:ABC transporter permease [Deltaproteobacteria bacterium]